MIPYLVHPFQEIKVTQKNQQWLNTERAVSVPEEAVTTLRAAGRRRSHYNREERRSAALGDQKLVQCNAET